MDSSRLNGFSQRFAATFFATFPNWLEGASDEGESDSERVLIVNVPAPHSCQEHASLRISTEDDEITVGFDYYHVHFNRYADDDEAISFQEAVEFARDLTNEQFVVVSWWLGERWQGSTTAVPHKSPQTPVWAKSADRIRIRSWLGTYDRDISTAAND